MQYLMSQQNYILWGTWAIFNGRDFVLGEAVEGIDELIYIGFQGVEIVDVRMFVERVKRGK